MTNAEAVEILKGLPRGWLTLTEKEALKLAILALQKEKHD